MSMEGVDQKKETQTHETVDRHDPKIIEALKNAPIYMKVGEVQMRPAIDGDPRQQYEALPENVKEELREKHNFDGSGLEGKRGELLITILKDGSVETPNIVAAGNPIVKNPGGEEYALAPEKFAKRYEPSGEREGYYKPTGFSRAIGNPFKKPIRMETEWGQIQTGNADCMLAVDCDPQGNITSMEPRIIGPKEFKETYSLF